MPNRDVQWVGMMLVLAGLLVWRIVAGFAGMNARIDDVRADPTMQITGVNARVGDMTAQMDRIETRLDRFDEQLHNVEIAFGKVTSSPSSASACRRRNSPTSKSAHIRPRTNSDASAGRAAKPPCSVARRAVDRGQARGLDRRRRGAPASAGAAGRIPDFPEQCSV